MLVSAIISNGRLLANVPNTNFYTDAEALFAVQLSWKDIYSFLCQNNDDYFVTKSYFGKNSSVAAGAFVPPTVYQVAVVGSTNFMAIGAASNTVGVVFTATGAGTGTGSAYPVANGLVPEPNRQFIYTYSVPSDFYRLRLFQYQGGAGNAQYNTIQKMTIENFGNSANSPSYRFVGQNIELFDQAGYTNFVLWYYPAPATLGTTTDLAYPLNMIPELMAYQVAIEIRRKQQASTELWEKRKNEITSSMILQMRRDDNQVESIKDVFSQGYSPYI